MKQTPADAGYRVVEYDDDEMIVEDIHDGRRELMVRCDGFAGWDLRHAGHNWQFVHAVADDATLTE